MQCQLRQLVLWPRPAGFAPRVLTFHPGALNIITGSSKTGKSAIIPIIDYCLGAGQCTIPVNTIRQSCAWFGVLLATERGELMLARREAGDARGASEMFMLEGLEVQVPDVIREGNTTVDLVKARLDDLAGLTRLAVDADGTFGSNARPSFRDMVALTFQPQSVIANPNVLFYKADTMRHREKLRAILPYMLGAVTPTQLSLQYEHDRLALDIRRRERDVERLQALSVGWVADIAGDIARARELGLLPVAPSPDTPPEELVEVLRGVVSRAEYDVQLVASDVSDVASQLAALRTAEIEASNALSAVRRRVTAMRDYQQTAATFGQTLTLRRDRLAVADWLAEHTARHADCPLCGAPTKPPAEAMAQLHAALEHVIVQTTVLERMPVAFDREYATVQADLTDATERLNAIRQQRRQLESLAATTSRPQFDVTATARFLGHLEDAVARYDALTEDDDAVALLDELRRRRDEIAGRLEGAGTQRRLRRILAQFSRLAGRIVPTLDAEFPDAPLELDVKELTLRVLHHDRDALLSELGSGANWLTYHIAASIAVHELLLQLKRNPVPTFVVYDQPSQVYFPRSADRVSTPNGANAPTGLTPARTPTSEAEAGRAARQEAQRQQDVEAVRRVYSALSAAVGRMEGRWQAVVVDHAQDDIWGGVPGIHVVGNWWDGEKLVPEAWISSLATTKGTPPPPSVRTDPK